MEALVGTGVNGDVDPEFEALVEQCLVALDAEGLPALERLCAQHPEQAEELRQRVVPLLTAGLVGQPRLDSLPERLGEFRILERLGGGGMGIVYRAVQTSLSREVALKVVRPEHLFFPGARERFRREVETVARLRHPGIAPVYAVGDENGVPFFAMELVEGLTLAEVAQDLRGRSPSSLRGEDLAALLARRASSVETKEAAHWSGPWPTVALRITHEIALALDHAHRRGVRHRDIKPSNVMVTAAGRVLLMDFGLASTLGTSRLTASGAHMGTTPYMPPERLRGDATPNEIAGDVYGVGVTLYELLTLRPPFLAADAEATRRLVLDGTPVHPRTLDRAISWEAETVCLKAMERDPARRYSSAAALAEDLARTASHQPISARRAGFALRVRRWARRHPAAAVGLALSALLLIVLTTLVVRERAQRRTLIEHTDGPLAEALIAQVSTLYPISPELVPALRAWLAKADDVLARRESHAAGLAALRERALPNDDAAQERDSKGKLQTQISLEEARRRLRNIDLYPRVLDPLESAETDRAVLSTRIDDLTNTLATRTVWQYTYASDQEHDAALTSAVAALDTLRPRRNEIEARLALALSLEDVTLVVPAHQWADALTAIAASPLYGGLKLRPQLGLIPLRENPITHLWEFWHVLSGARPVTAPLPEDAAHIAVVGDTGIVLVLIPGGTFIMGAEPSPTDGTESAVYHDPSATLNEGPAHAAKIGPFFLSKYELTQGQWLRWTGRNPSQLQGPVPWMGEHEFGFMHPVECVDSSDVARVSAEMGLALPTEMQWEWACRAGTVSPWYSGAELISLLGFENVADSSFADSGNQTSTVPSLPLRDGWVQHAPVGSLLPNPFGLYDMGGNVSEHCRDEFWQYNGAQNLEPDGLLVTLHPTMTASAHVLRGGNWAYSATWARSAYRMSMKNRNVAYWIGVRFCRPIEP